MKTLTLTIALLFASLFNIGRADDVVISVNELPKTAQIFIATHFDGLEIAYAKKDDGEYEVKFSNGYSVEFNRRGDWKEVDCNNDPVPESVIALIPNAIPQYIANAFPKAAITKVQKERRHYEIELNNDLDLEFTSDGVLCDIDN